MTTVDATPIPHATGRQMEILRMAAVGMPDKEIAWRLGISYGTIRTHLGRFFIANGVHDRTAAVALWIRRGGEG